jgi:hypothetical protein
MKHSINIRLNHCLHAILEMKESLGAPNEYVDMSLVAVNGRVIKAAAQHGRLPLNL